MEKMVCSIYYKLILVFSFFCLSACSLNRIPLDENQRNTIRQSQEVLTSNQEQLIAEHIDPNVSYPAAPGLTGIIVGAAINSAIASHANAETDRLMEPLQKNLANFSVNKEMSTQIAQQLKPVKWLHFDRHGVMNTLTGTQKKAIVNNMNDNEAVIFVNLSYQLASPNLDVLKIIAAVEIQKRDVDKPRIIYKNKFSYFEKIEVSKRSHQDIISTWAEYGAARARHAFNTSISLLSKAIVKDIQDPTIKPDNKHPTNIWYITSAETAGHLEEKIGDKYVIRTAEGEIVIVNSPLARTKHNWREY